MPDIAVWPECNIGCVFCSNPVSGYRGTGEKYTLAEFQRKWKRFKAGRRGVFLKFDGVRDAFTLTGGEPTLHPEFLPILATIRKDAPGRRIKLLTNGRLLRYRDFARRVLGVAQAPFEVAIALFGPDRATHDSIARAPGSFEDTTAGLDNLFELRRAGQKIEFRIILTRIQMRWLKSLLDYLLKRFPPPDSLDLLFVELEGFAARYARQLTMPMLECASRIEALAPTLDLFPQWRLLHFALCAVPRGLWPHVWNTLDPIKVSWAPGCASCAVKKDCVGISKGYAEAAGVAEFKPLREDPGMARTGDWYHPFSLPGEAAAAPRAGQPAGPGAIPRAAACPPR